jgi:hypothetical protein
MFAIAGWIAVNVVAPLIAIYYTVISGPSGDGGIN